MKLCEPEVLRKLRYLLIEDNLGDGVLFKKALQGAVGPLEDFTQAESLQQAILFAELALPDVVFMDLSLPDVHHSDSLMGLRKFLEFFPMLDVILITGSVDTKLPLRALELGAKDFVNKNELREDNLMRVVQFCLHRSEMRKDLMHARIRAEEAQLAQGRFVANMSHEMRTPLNTIIGYAELVMDDLGEDDVDLQQAKDSVEQVHRSGKHLLYLISEVLELSRVEANRSKVLESIFSLSSLLEEVSDGFGWEHTLNPVTFRLVGEIPEVIYADEQKLKQILTNLVSNGLKFSGGKAVEVDCRVEIDNESEECLLCFVVEDRGPGLTKVEQAKIFEAFTQLDATATRSHDGSGLGLYLVKHFCHLMKGRVWVNSEVGVGSSFHVELPVRLRPSRKKAVAPPQQGNYDEILVMDKDDAARCVLMSQCAHLGYQVVDLPDWQAALDHMDRQKRQLYLVDLDVLRADVDSGLRSLHEQMSHINCRENTAIYALVLTEIPQLQQWLEDQLIDQVMCKPSSLKELTGSLTRFL